MYKKLLATTSTAGIGVSQQRRLFKIESGPYLGRMAALVQTSAAEIKLIYADPPYTNWSSPFLLANDADDSAFDAVLDSSGNIQLVYGENGIGYLVTRRLSFSARVWNVGTKSVVYNGPQTFTPSIGIEPSGKLWVAWCRYTAPNRVVYVKSSSDNGATWGTGAGDAGQQLSSGSPSENAKLLVAPDQIHVVIAYGGSRIVMRSLPIAGGTWSDEVTIASGGSGFTEAFDAAVRSDGLVAVVYNDTQFRYREFDGINWGGIVTLNNLVVESPQLVFRGQIPVVAFIASWSGLQRIMKVTERSSGSFSTPVALETRAKVFDSVILFEASSGIYQEVTAAAGNVTTGDVFHNSSSTLLKHVGDQVFLGMDDRFRYIGLSLSTTGAGGTISYSYWDGLNWRGITPSSGNAYLDQTDSRVLLWDDFSSVPSDWQKKSISGKNQFWVKLEVQSAFATGPVGSHITAISEIQHLTFRR
jgi:hypothetical protein